MLRNLPPRFGDGEIQVDEIWGGDLHPSDGSQQEGDLKFKKKLSKTKWVTFDAPFAIVLRSSTLCQQLTATLLLGTMETGLWRCKL